MSLPEGTRRVGDCPEESLITLHTPQGNPPPMTIKDLQKYQALSQIFNKTWGIPSPRSSSTESQIFRIADDEHMSAMFLIVVNFSSEKMWHELRKKHRLEGFQKLVATLKQAEKEYKEKTGNKITLTAKQGTLTDSLEFLNYSLYNPKRTAYFRLFCQVEIS